MSPPQGEEPTVQPFRAPDQGIPSNLIRAPQLPPRGPAEPGGFSFPADQRQFRGFLLPAEKPSDYELFVSGKTEITETQLEFLRNFQGIAFSTSPRTLPSGNVSVPVRILRRPEKAEKSEKPEKQEKAEKTLESFGGESKGLFPEVEAGYIEGAIDVIATAFKLLGIKSPYVVSTDLKQFGYDLFLLPPSTFAPADRVPVGPDYVLGPGDTMRITVWGRIEGTWDVVVDREGTVTLPKIGVVGVTGLSFQELKTLLQRELSKYYTGFEMNVSLGPLRSIKVYLVGNAQRPGAYTISSLSTLVNALFEGGGPSKTGSMRDIQLKRNGETVVHFDLYDFLLKGDKSNDARLMPEDVIFIPPIGPLAAVAGNVNNPAVYELKDERTISRLIEMAGGLNTIAFQGRIQVERIVENRRQTVFESDWEKVRESEVPLEPGDIVKVFQVVQDRRMVKISGAVQREGEYGYTPAMTVKDLISLAGGLKYYAYRKELELTRVAVTETGPRTEKFIIDLEKVMEGDPKTNIPLAENDYLFVRTVPEWKLYQTVTIAGEVKYPGTYTILKGERLSSLIERAGRFTDRAFLKGAVFTRERVRELQQTQLNESVDRLEKELAGRSALSVAIASSPEEARIKEFEIQRMNAFLVKLRQAKAKGRMVVTIADPAALRETKDDIELEEGDSLIIPANPRSIQVAGSVFNQTAFVFDAKKSIRNYVDLAGGYTENADTKRVYVLKVDGTATRPGEGWFSSLAWNRDASRWEYGARELDPGDTIIVPEQLERIAWLREFKDITQILYQVAVTAGVLIVAF
jgi:protein involved in polysaccharide export with SLBB domain